MGGRPPKRRGPLTPPGHLSTGTTIISAGPATRNRPPQGPRLAKFRELIDPCRRHTRGADARPAEMRGSATLNGMSHAYRESGPQAAFLIEAEPHAARPGISTPR